MGEKTGCVVIFSEKGCGQVVLDGGPFLGEIRSVGEFFFTKVVSGLRLLGFGGRLIVRAIQKSVQPVKRAA